jgi:hypothetical protein
MLSSWSGAVRPGIKIFMLDWFSRERITNEQDQCSHPLAIGAIVPDFALRMPYDGIFFLSEISGPFAVLVLPSELTSQPTQLLRTFAEKYREVRPQITRAVVVTRPDHLSTVVALGGDMLILSDVTGDVVVQLATEDPMLYMLDDHRRVLNIARIDERFPWFIPRSLRPAA